jgi:hypothetical protein
MAAIHSDCGRDGSALKRVTLIRRELASWEDAMNPGTYLYGVPPGRQDHHGGFGWALVIAILFLALAAGSFAIEQTVTLSSVPAPPPTHIRIR